MFKLNKVAAAMVSFCVMLSTQANSAVVMSANDDVVPIQIFDAGGANVFGQQAGAIVSGDATFVPRPDVQIPGAFAGDDLILSNGDVSTVQDVPHSGGFNRTTGRYEFKFTLTQDAVVDALSVDSTAIMPSIFIYDPNAESINDQGQVQKGFGYMMVINCSVPPGAQNICGFTKVGQARQARGYTVDEISSQFGVDNIHDVTGTQINATNGAIGLIYFDDLDPQLVTSKVADLVGSGQTINYEMRSVPVPAAFWLFGSALIGLIGLKKAKR